MKQRRKISSNTCLAGLDRVEVVKLSLMSSNRSRELSHQDSCQQVIWDMSAIPQRIHVDGTCCSHCKDLAVHVTEEMEAGCHTIVNTRSEGSPAYTAGQVLLLSLLVLFTQLGWRQEPHQNKLAKGTFRLWKGHGISQEQQV